MHHKEMIFPPSNPYSLGCNLHKLSYDHRELEQSYLHVQMFVRMTHRDHTRLPHQLLQHWGNLQRSEIWLCISLLGWSVRKLTLMKVEVSYDEMLIDEKDFYYYAFL